MDYLTPKSPDAFLDKVKKEIPTKYYPQLTQECPQCHGYGGWNLKLNAYGEGKHFQCFCTQCNGWGYVDPFSTDATCIHTTKELTQAECRKRGITHHGMCWHVTECIHCGKISAYDSSD